MKTKNSKNNYILAEDPLCIDEPGWRPDSPGTPGTVDCNGQTSPYQVNAICDYKCPPGNENHVFLSLHLLR